MEKWKVEKQNAEFSLNSCLRLKKPILATSNSRFVSWLVQFLSEFLSLNQYFVYFWIVKCRNYATRQSGKTLCAILPKNLKIKIINYEILYIIFSTYNTIK